MTYIHNDPQNFWREMVDGFIAAHPDRVIEVPGGVVRATEIPQGQVAVVTGGGSGHYPTFPGLVGPGLAHGSAMGNIFASPSTQQVYSVAKAVETGAGVILVYGNYTGDCLNFDAAQDRLRSEGIDCETVRVTDDISSAKPDECAKRRGIAGDICVIKSAAWAAEQGRSLADVTAFAAHANDRLRSFGVAFSGCTLPGAEAPLFTLPDGMMGVGMGIHGEPGLRNQELLSGNEIAQMLTDGLLAEAPADGSSKVAILVDGLGSVSYEELFVLFGLVNRRLTAAGIQVVEPEVGELCTSLDMAGVSLTMFWLDDELELAWRAPADSTGYRKGAVASQATRRLRPTTTEASPQDHVVNQDSQQSAHLVAKALSAASAYVNTHVDELGALDAIAGDGDHGIGMQRGAEAASKAATKSAEQGMGPSAVLLAAGDAWADAAGGTSGALWGLLLRSVGSELENDALTANAVANGVQRGAAAIMRVGKAEVGDKTMVDALVPFAAELSRQVAQHGDLLQAWRAAAQVASEAAAATASLMAKAGRARPHAEQSIGSPDPGAVSLAGILTAIGEAMA